MEDYGTIGTLIDIMNANGVREVFFNPGIDNVPLLETISQYSATGKTAPRGILCLDEFVAMTAAHGNYMASGRPQVVSVHSELGTMQIGGALHNAQWGKVPVVFFTEIQGPAQRTDWMGESFDQGKMVRNFVKWDHQMTADEDICDIFNRAFGIATTEPYGPVYVTLPREELWKKCEMKNDSAADSREPHPHADTGLLIKAADVLLEAKNPVIVTGYLGRNLDAVPLLVKLAEILGAGVLTSDTRVNFPGNHPLAVYMPPSGGPGYSPISTADVILAIDYDMHYASPPITLKADTKIIHIDIDTMKKGMSLWNKKPDILLKADSSQALELLTAIISQKLTSQKIKIIQKRYVNLSAEHKKLEEEWRSLALSHANRSPISAHWLSHCINEVIDDDTIVVNQTISPASIVAHLVRRSKPGTLLSCAGGCIGWAPGAALGVKLAQPYKTVISLMGDGAFIYGCPEATLWSAGFYKAPFLSIIYDNQGYGAIKGLFKNKYPVDNMGADIYSPPDYAGIAKACHAYGHTVTAPSDVLPALKEGLKQVRAGRSAVLDIKIEPI